MWLYLSPTVAFLNAAITPWIFFEFVYSHIWKRGYSFFFFFSRPDGKCIYKRYYKKPVTHTIPACYSCKILACCMQQNNKLKFQRNIKLEFSQTYHNFNQSLRNTGKLSIFKEYAIQYSNKMEESLGSIWHKKDAVSINTWIRGESLMRRIRDK